MIDYISGKLVKLSPTTAVIDNQGIGYSIEISLQTYDVINGKEEVKLYIQNQVNQRDGSEIDYGFASISERSTFRDITSVSGMGAATARMILSTFGPEELKEAILAENVNKIKSVKGLGLKTAQRLVLELKDKIVKGGETDLTTLLKVDINKAAEEATVALQNLGFSKPNINKAVQNILKTNPSASVEEIIKAALKSL